MGLIPGQGTKVLRATWLSRKKKKQKGNLCFSQQANVHITPFLFFDVRRRGDKYLYKYERKNYKVELLRSGNLEEEEQMLQTRWTVQVGMVKELGGG